MPRTDEERLQLFGARVTSLLSRRAVTDGTLRARFSTGWSVESGSFLDTDHGDEEDVRSLLPDVRTFMSQGEDVYFPKIADIVQRVVLDDELRDASIANRNSWKEILKSGAIGLNVGGTLYTPQRCFDLVVNGDLFHMDEEKAREFDSLDLENQQIVLTNVNSLVIRMVKLLRAERNLVDDAFDPRVLDFTREYAKPARPTPEA